MAVDENNRRAFAFLLLHVTPENDNVPLFTLSKYELDVWNNIQEEEPVFIVSFCLFI